MIACCSSRTSLRRSKLSAFQKAILCIADTNQQGTLGRLCGTYRNRRAVKIVSGRALNAAHGPQAVPGYVCSTFAGRLALGQYEGRLLQHQAPWAGASSHAKAWNLWFPVFLASS